MKPIYAALWLASLAVVFGAGCVIGIAPYVWTFLHFPRAGAPSRSYNTV